MFFCVYRKSQHIRTLILITHISWLLFMHFCCCCCFVFFSSPFIQFRFVFQHYRIYIAVTVDVWSNAWKTSNHFIDTWIYFFYFHQNWAHPCSRKGEMILRYRQMSAKIVIFQFKRYKLNRQTWLYLQLCRPTRTSQVKIIQKWCSNFKAYAIFKEWALISCSSVVLCFWICNSISTII